jgi:hypothetical protein
MPRVSLPGHGRIATSRIPVALSWTVTAARPIADVQVEARRDGARSWKKVRVATATARQTTVRLRAGRWHFRVRATDVGGMVGPWTDAAAVRLRLKQQTAAVLTQHGVWRKVAVVSSLGGTVARSNARGAKATFVFSATAVSWVGTLAPDRGKARVYIDGKSQGVVDLYARSTVTRRIIITRSFGPGRHVLQIRALGTGRRDARDDYVGVDAFLTLG